MAKILRVLPHMCKQQRQDLSTLMEAADEIGAAATSVIAQGGMGYTLLLEARDKFRTLLTSIIEHYRICEEEDEAMSFQYDTIQTSNPNNLKYDIKL